jgi:hypothetical protein
VTYECLQHQEKLLGEHGNKPRWRVYLRHWLSRIAGDSITYARPPQLNSRAEYRKRGSDIRPVCLAGTIARSGGSQRGILDK